MTRWLQRGAYLAAVILASAATLSAQTVIVRDAPAGGTIELVINNAVVGTDTANANGRVTLIVPGSRPDMDALVSVDSCGTRRRINIAQPSTAVPPPEAACVRRDIPGLFLIRGVSTIVFNVEGASPRLLLRQGPFNPDAPPKTWAAVPSGLMVSGGFGWGGLSNVLATECGAVVECSADDSGIPLGAGAEFWFGRYVALEVGFLKPAVASAEGSGTGFRFTSELDVRLITVGGKIGVPAGPARIYGRGGMNRHRALSTLSQTIDDRTVTINDVTSTITGGTQQMQYETEGYGWYVGGGVELWWSRHLATYAGVDFNKIKGSDRGAGEAAIDDKHISVMLGIRLRLGK